MSPPEPTDASPAEPALASASGLSGRVWSGLRGQLAILATDRLTWFSTLTAAIVLTASRYHFSTGEYQQLATPEIQKHGGLYAAAAHGLHLHRLADWLQHTTSSAGDHLYWFLGSLVFFYVVPLLGAKLTPGIRMQELGNGLGDWRYGLKAVGVLYGVMLPFVVGASFLPAFAAQYPMSGGAAACWQSLLIYEASYAAYFIGWEFIYRGLLCVALYPRIGAAVILLQAIPFAVMHAGKPEPEAFGAIVAALALGVIAVRARSFWYGALTHSLVAVTMDVLALTHSHRWPKVW